MKNINYIKPSQVIDFDRTTYRHTAAIDHILSCSILRIIYRRLKLSKSANSTKQPRPSYLAKPARIYEVLQYICDSKGQYSKDRYAVSLRTPDENMALDKVKRNLEQGFRSQIKKSRWQHGREAK